MKPVVAILVVVLLSGTVSLRAQETSTSRAILDSLSTLSESQYTLDSLKLNIWSDSFKSRIGMVHQIDSLNLISKIDSMRNLDLNSRFGFGFPLKKKSKHGEPSS